MQLHVF